MADKALPEILITITGQQGIGKSKLGAAIARLLDDHMVPATVDGVDAEFIAEEAVKTLNSRPYYTVRIVTRTP